MIDVVVGDSEKERNQDMQENEIDKPVATEAPSSKSQEIKQESGSDFKALLYFIIAILLYTTFAMMSLNEKYVDFGDGNYLYLSWRLTEGDVLYKDLPSPQPPLLLFLGAFWLKLLGGDPTLLRLWQIVQHCLIACCVWGITARLFKRPIFSSAAGIIYLFLPEGVWWAAGYQSEPLLILLQCFNVLLFITAMRREKPSWALYGTAIFSALSCYTNMTAAPYVALQWFFVGFRFRRFFLRYSLALVIPGLSIFAFMWIYSSGQYVEHVFFRQVGTYPADTLMKTLSYFIGKLYSEGGDIIFYEGGFVIACIVGMMLYFGEDRKDPVDEYVLWWAIFSLGSIIFVTKGGTVEYIFTLGEPAVAIFSAYFFLTLFAASDLTFDWKQLRSPVPFGKFVLLVCLFLPIVLMKPYSLLYRAFTNGPLINEMAGLKEQGVWELSDAEMKKASMFIQRHCPANKTLIAPPYYAFLSQRKLAENSSSLFILFFAYFTECERLAQTYDLPFDLPTLTNVSLYHSFNDDIARIELTSGGYLYEKRYNNEGTFYNTQTIYDLSDYFDNNPSLKMEFPAINLFLNMRKQIIKKEVGLIAKNMRHFFFYVPPLHQAVRDFCKEIEIQPSLKNREEHIVFYEPK